jgi:hypothetical protein
MTTRLTSTMKRKVVGSHGLGWINTRAIARIPAPVKMLAMAGSGWNQSMRP